MSPKSFTLPNFFAGLAFIALGTFLATLIFNATTQLISPRISQSLSQVVTNKNNAFYVTGEAEINTVPDQAQISLGITANSTTVKDAQDQVNSTINSFTEALNSLGIEKNDIQTSNYSLYPNYDYSGEGQNPKITGYTASTSVDVTVKDFAKVNQVIDLATNSGINQINGLEFTLSKDKEAEVKQQARAEAIADAQKNAQEISGLTNMRLGRIIDVMENNYNDAVQPKYNYEAALSADAVGMGGGTDVQVGSTAYTFSVTLSYETL